MNRSALRPAVSILTTGHDLADARLHRVVGGLIRAGLTVEVLGLGGVSSGPAGAQCRSFKRGGLLRRALNAGLHPLRANGQVFLALDPDALLGARWIGALRRRLVVADVHEDYAALLRDRSWAQGIAGRVAAGLVGLATRAAAQVALTVVADDHVPPLVANRRMVVRNEPDLRLLGEVGVPDSQPRAVYVGDVRASRGLSSMLTLIQASPLWRLDVIGPLAAQDREWLTLALVIDHDLSDRVRMHGRLAPEQAWRVAAGAWVGLCLLEPTPAFRDAVPSKIYEYLAMGIIPLVTDLPRQRELIERASCGRVVADSTSAAASLAELVADPVARQQEASRGQDWARAHCQGRDYDHLATTIRELLDAGS